jgi:hypothetical protein
VTWALSSLGYIVYHHRNVYFCRHYNYSHAESLGEDLLASLRLGQPHSITDLEKSLGEILDKLMGVLCLESIMEDYFIISGRRPHYDISMAWTYEIDLDRNIFHVDGIPFFHLGCLPSDDIFIEYVSEECRNHYDNFDCAPGLPPCHKHKRPAPPAVADSDLATCQSSVCVGTHMALSNLLAVNEILSPIEHVRVSLLEMMIGQFMRHELITRMFYQFELATDHTQLTDEDWSIAYSMVNLAFTPQIFDIESRFTYHQQLKRTGFIWVREDTVLYIATYLDDKRCLQASVSRLINAILERDDPGDYF